MFKNTKKFSTWSVAFASISAATAASFSPMALGQDEMVEEVIVTGSRIRRPGLESGSPITSIGAEEIQFQQEVEVERILRDLPSTIPGDGENTNNGTAGISSVDLRGLGAERNLVLINGRRMTPANYDGRPDISTIPTALIERVDIITGGASAVYGSDAIAGAVNIIMKNDFQGFDLLVNSSTSGDNDADRDMISMTLGSALEGGRGHVALNLSWSEREPLLLGQREIGTVGIQTGNGAGLTEFLAGQGSTVPPAGCGGPNVAATGGSTTSMPTFVNFSKIAQFLQATPAQDWVSGEGVRCSTSTLSIFSVRHRNASTHFLQVISSSTTTSKFTQL